MATTVRRLDIHDDEEWEDWDDNKTNTALADVGDSQRRGSGDGINKNLTSGAFAKPISIHLPAEEDADVHFDQGVVNVDLTEVENEEKVDEVLVALKEFQSDLADASVLERINRRLASQSYDQFCSYYESNSKLSLYTIETELKVIILPTTCPPAN
jgi:hypothetical protein